MICVDVDEETFSDEVSRSLFYVGTSRAKTWLDILTMSSQERLAAVITETETLLKRPQAVKVVRDSLCVKIGSKGDLTEQGDLI